jgi:hypothetical protein
MELKWRLVSFRIPSRPSDFLNFYRDRSSSDMKKAGVWRLYFMNKELNKLHLYIKKSSLNFEGIQNVDRVNQGFFADQDLVKNQIINNL